MEQEKISASDTAKVFCEEWKDIQGYEGIYQISNLGRVKSLKRKNNRCRSDKILKQYIGKTGYMQLRLCKGHETKLWKVHVLIAKAFIDNPDNLPIINHIDADKTNNDISNLEWCSYSQNNKHAYDNGLRKTKSLMQIALNGTPLKRWSCITEASQKTGIGVSSIWKCCNHQRTNAGGFKWQYIE